MGRKSVSYGATSASLISITSSAAGIIFTFGGVMDIRLAAMFALFVRHLARLSSFFTALDREIGAAPKLD